MENRKKVLDFINFFHKFELTYQRWATVKNRNHKKVEEKQLTVGLDIALLQHIFFVSTK